MQKKEEIFFNFSEGIQIEYKSDSDRATEIEYFKSKMFNVNLPKLLEFEKDKILENNTNIEDIKTKENENKFDYECMYEGCKEKFKKTSQRNKHLKTHYKTSKIFMCNEENCNNEYKNFCSLQNHILTVHKQKRPYKCLFCDRDFRQRHCILKLLI